jgi:hypothetical protein
MPFAKISFVLASLIITMAPPTDEPINLASLALARTTTLVGVAQVATLNSIKNESMVDICLIIMIIFLKSHLNSKIKIETKPSFMQKSRTFIDKCSAWVRHF